MSSIVVAGNTSGTITLQAPAVSGSTVLNLPTISGGTMYTSTAAGDLYLGSTDSIGVAGTLDRLRVSGTNGPSSSIALFRYSNDQFSGNLRSYHSRATSIGTQTAVQSGDYLANVVGYGSDGTNWVQGASFTVYADGTPSTGIMPSGLGFGVVNSSGVGGFQAHVRANGNFEFNSGYGSPAVAYGCRAWVNFNGTGTVAIRGSGNVTSITDNGTGDYTVNFTTAMPDANYAVTFGGNRATTARDIQLFSLADYTTSSFRIYTNNSSTAALDWALVNVSVHR